MRRSSQWWGLELETFQIFENATVRGRFWYALLDSPVIIYKLPPNATVFLRSTLGAIDPFAVSPQVNATADKTGDVVVDAEEFAVVRILIPNP